MQKVTSFLKKHCISIGLSLLIIDQLIKHNIKNPVLNYGASFSILQNERWLLLGVSFVVMIAIGYLFWKNKDEFMPIPYTLIFFGALSNFIDRLMLGYVIDYIPFPYFPTFNIGDSMISIGVVFFFWYEFIHKKKKKSHK